MSRVQRSLRSAALIAAATLIVVAFLAPSVASAWTAPTVTPQCAPDEDHFAFTVTLTGTESSYNFDWSFGTSGVWTTVAGHLGNNELIVVRASGDLWVRWSGDHSSMSHATPDATLCASPSPSATSPVESESIPPSPTPTPTMAPTPTPTPTPTATTPVESESLPPTPTPTPTGSVLPTASATSPVESESLPPSMAPSHSAAPSGAVLGLIGGATTTPPPTDTAAKSATAGDGWQVVLLGMAALLALGFALVPVRRRR